MQPKSLEKLIFLSVLLTFLLISSLDNPLVTVQAPSLETNELHVIPELSIKGADISFLPQIEDNDGKFYDNGSEEDLILILKSHGVNSIRLRIWNDPIDGYCSKNQTLDLAKRLKNEGFQFLLDFHYSDSWADPSRQNKPLRWSTLSFLELKQAVYNYTNEVITELKNQGTTPDMVQIGNEITCGFLWNTGRVCGDFNNDAQWNQFADLIRAGITGVRDGLEGETVKIMLHIDRGGYNIGSRWFFDNILEKNVSFDVIGQSFYPWWHGSLEDLKQNLEDLALRYNKEICVVETAYPWTLNWSDTTNNIVGLEGQLLEGYPATVQGQKQYLLDLKTIISEVPSSKGIGFFYWAPERISTTNFGSSWENLALFDFNGNVLESISTFEPLNQTTITSSSSTSSSSSTVTSLVNDLSSTTTSSPGFEIVAVISTLIYIMIIIVKRKNDL